MDNVFCTNCGTVMSRMSVACPSCGHPNKESKTGLKSKVIFVLLALFLGWFGIHRLYSGDIILGLIYMLFFWTAIPMLIAPIEALVIGLRKNDSRFE